MEIVFVALIFGFIVFALIFIFEAMMVAIGGLLMIIILPFAALFDGIDAIKKPKKVRKGKEDPRDGPTVLRVSKSDLRNRPVNRPTVWRRKR